MHLIPARTAERNGSAAVIAIPSGGTASIRTAGRTISASVSSAVKNSPQTKDARSSVHASVTRRTENPKAMRKNRWRCNSAHHKDRAAAGAAAKKAGCRIRACFDSQGRNAAFPFGAGQLHCIKISELSWQKLLILIQCNPSRFQRPHESALIRTSPHYIRTSPHYVRTTSARVQESNGFHKTDQEQLVDAHHKRCT